MNASPHTFKTLASFLDLVSDAQAWRKAGADWYLQPWFRGHASANWELTPSIYRMPQSPDVDYYTDKRLLDLFKLRAPARILSESRGRNGSGFS